MSRTAPTKNMAAPMKVNELATVALFSSPVAGMIRAPIAEIPKAIQPAILMAAIHQAIDAGFQHHSLWQTSTSASPLATRKMIDPKASGAHTKA